MSKNDNTVRAERGEHATLFHSFDEAQQGSKKVISNVKYLERPRQDQSRKEECDINRILDRAKHQGTISHLAKYQPLYGDFRNFDYEAMEIQLAEARSVFYDLPAETRSEFDNSPTAFFNYVNDPANADSLEERLPELAQPGRQFPDVIGGTTAAFSEAVQSFSDAVSAAFPSSEASPEDETSGSSPPAQAASGGEQTSS